MLSIGTKSRPWTTLNGVSRDCTKFLKYSVLSQERVKIYGLQIWPVHSQGPSEQKPIKKFREKGAWAYPGTAQCFRISPIISGTGKATDFKCCVHIYRLNRNKSPLKILEKRECGRIQGLLNFWGVPPIISGTGKATDFKFGQYILNINVWKFFEEKEAWAYPGTAQFFRISPIISGTGKATDFKFGK